MEHRFSIRTIQAAGAIIAALIIASVCVMPSKLGDTDAVGIAMNAHGETGPLVLVQYNPCPNGKCR